MEEQLTRSDQGQAAHRTRVLVTGGSGFVGSHVVRRLAQSGRQVIVFDAKEPGAEARWLLAPWADQITLVCGALENAHDLLRCMERYRPQAVVHAGAIVDPIGLADRPLDALQVNVAGTIHALEAARQHGCNRFVFMSSIDVLPRLQYEPVDANHPVMIAGEGPSASFYGAIKLAGEAFCLAYHDACGLEVVVLRCSSAYGFGMNWPIYVKPLVENAVRGEATHFDHGGQFPRDYVYVADIAQLVERALEVEPDRIHDRIYYAATGRPLVTASMVADVVRELYPGAEMTIQSRLSAHEERDLRHRGILSIVGATEQLGYLPLFDIRTGIADYVHLYRNYRNEVAGGWTS